MCVYPMPLVREASFSGVGVAVCPCSCTAYGAVVLRFEDLGEGRRCLGVEEGLSHESNLVVYCLLSAVDRVAWIGSSLPSVFQAAVPASQSKALKKLLVEVIMCWV